MSDFFGNGYFPFGYFPAAYFGQTVDDGNYHGWQTLEPLTGEAVLEIHADFACDATLTGCTSTATVTVTNPSVVQPAQNIPPMIGTVGYGRGPETPSKTKRKPKKANKKGHLPIEASSEIALEACSTKAKLAVKWPAIKAVSKSSLADCTVELTAKAQWPVLAAEFSQNLGELTTEIHAAASWPKITATAESTLAPLETISKLRKDLVRLASPVSPVSLAKPVSPERPVQWKKTG